MPAKRLAKTQLLQIIAQEAETDRRIAAFFLDVLAAIAYRDAVRLVQDVCNTMSIESFEAPVLAVC